MTVVEMSSFANLQYNEGLGPVLGARYRQFNFGVSLDETIFGALT
jgi:hypothetical protein